MAIPGWDKHDFFMWVQVRVSNFSNKETLLQITNAGGINIIKGPEDL